MKAAVPVASKYLAIACMPTLPWNCRTVALFLDVLVKKGEWALGCIRWLISGARVPVLAEVHFQMNELVSEFLMSELLIVGVGS